MILTREANEHLLDTYYNFIHTTHNYVPSQLCYSVLKSFYMQANKFLDIVSIRAHILLNNYVVWMPPKDRS